MYKIDIFMSYYPVDEHVHCAMNEVSSMGEWAMNTGRAVNCVGYQCVSLLSIADCRVVVMLGAHLFLDEESTWRVAGRVAHK